MEPSNSGTARAGRAIGTVLGVLGLLGGGLLALVGGFLAFSVALSPAARVCEHECYGYGFIGLIGFVLLSIGVMTALIGLILTLATRTRGR